jgi:hypothetical protein
MGRLCVTNKLTGEVLYDEPNTIMYDGREMLNYAFAGERAIDPVKYIAVGTGGYYPGAVDPNTNPPAPSEEGHALHTEILRKPIFLPVQHTTRMSSVCNIELGETECVNIKLTEFALITQGNIMFARRTTMPITKIAQMILSITWTILF